MSAQTLRLAATTAWIVAAATVATPLATVATGAAVALTITAVIEAARIDRQSLVNYGAALQAAGRTS